VLTPPELAGCDLRVSAVASLYGQVGLDTMFEHTSQHGHPDDPQPDWDAPPPARWCGCSVTTPAG
jgi:hypothetical protein